MSYQFEPGQLFRIRDGAQLFNTRSRFDIEHFLEGEIACMIVYVPDPPELVMSELVIKDDRSAGGPIWLGTLALNGFFWIHSTELLMP